MLVPTLEYPFARQLTLLQCIPEIVITLSRTNVTGDVFDTDHFFN